MAFPNEQSTQMNSPGSASHRSTIVSGAGADLRSALRQLRSRIGGTAIAVATIAFSCGAAAAIYGLADGLLSHPAPYDRPSQLVFVRQYSPERCPRCYDMPASTFNSLGADGDSVAALLAEQDWPAVLRAAETTETLSAAKVSPRFFRELHARAAMGRTFVDDDSVVAGPQPVVLAQAAWRVRFAADSQIIGKQLILDGQAHMVIGVLGEDQSFPPQVELFGMLPAAGGVQNQRPNPAIRYNVFGRLRGTHTVSELNARLGVSSRRLAAEFPAEMKGWRIRAEPIGGWHNDVGPGLTIASAAVALLMIVAWANLSGLLVARVTSRRAELAIRAALGADGWRLRRLLFLEMLLIAVMGGIAAAGVAALSLEALKVGVPSAIANYQPGWQRLQINWQTVAFGMGVSVLTSIIATVLGTRRASSMNLGADLLAFRSPNDPRQARSRRRLIAFEIAVSVVLLSSSGLLFRSVAKMRDANLGIRPDSVLTMALQLPQAGVDSAQTPNAILDALLADLQSVPGVRAVGVTTALPLGGHQNGGSFSLQGEDGERSGDGGARLQAVTPGYLDAIGARIVSGRNLNDQDRPGSEPVAVVNRSLEKRYLRGASALGRSIKVGTQTYRIVGVSSDVYHNGVTDEPGAEILLPRGYSRSRVAELALRTSSGTSVTSASVLRLLHDRYAQVGISRVTSMRNLVASSITPFRVLMIVIGAFAGIATLISALGIYGLVNYSVAARRREFGIRLAVGATPISLLRKVLGDGLRLAAVGIGLGLIGSALAGRTMSFILYRVPPYDVATYATITAIILLTSLVAVLVPAIEASRIDPVQSLSSN